MLRGTEGDTRILDAEAEDVATVRVPERSDRGIVDVQHQRQRRIERSVRSQCALPALGDRIDFAVAIELIAKQVQEDRGARAQARQQPGPHRLVQFDNAQAASGARDRAGQIGRAHV